MISSPSLFSHLDDPGLLPPVQAPDHKYITCFDPSNGMHLGTLPADNVADIGGKIAKATKAQQSWRKSDFSQRRRVIRSLLKWLVENRE